MSEENNNEEVVEKNIPVFIETDGHTVQVGYASEVNEAGGRAIEKFSAFKKVVLVNPIFGDGEGEISTPDIESHIDPEEDGLTGPGNETQPEEDGLTVAGTDADVLGVTPEFFRGEDEDEEAAFERELAEEEARKNSQPVDGGTDESLNAAPVSADPDGDTAVGQPLPAGNKGDWPNPFTRTN